eukprot:CAMPEP_0177680344 /NCGR_PEP_ID=MMETSP0447-20121125/30121_1 /TAXON_ID=0 /ORGANISM="Stygamoeba regulata, Strain BSH-02190019" /LENGTH=231 /DNA_ID=CAMNT_0019189665 /DNA_START=38 /DNA_END=733 /DNA_ORIENTATION=-
MERSQKEEETKGPTGDSELEDLDEDEDGDVWIFGYGSLIFRPMPFPWLERCWARLPGYIRRFWQGSTDHRGTPENPGRVVTLLTLEEYAAARDRFVATLCDDDDEAKHHIADSTTTFGVAYRVGAAHRKELFAYLDHREKGGYVREVATAYVVDGAPLDESRSIRCVVYRATPINAQWLGPSTYADMAAQIARSHGPSGPNPEYLFGLQRALVEAQLDDPHVSRLVSLLPV